MNALRAFESAARHNSFVAAANELCVTPGAISQHIKTLENWAGVSLFLRQPKGVELTQAGHSLVDDFVCAFDALANATHALRNLQPRTEIHIAALPSIAQLWLPSRLGRIREAFPSITLSVTAMETPPSMARELFDLSLFFQEPNGKPDQLVLCTEKLTPVCSPHLAAQMDPANPFQSVPLLHDQAWEGDWATWAVSAGMTKLDTHLGPHLSLYSLAVEEAKSSAGLLMGHLSLLESALQSGALVRVSDHVIETGQALVLELPRRARRRAEVEAIANALLE